VKVIPPGSHGPEVADVQQRLVALGSLVDAVELDGSFGASTEAAVRRFQSQRNIHVDGIVGPETWSHLVEAGYAFGDRTLYLRYPYFRGDDVRELQRKLNALGFDAWREDGIFGEHVDRAVRELQRNTGAAVDGIVGPGTFETLERLRPDTSGPGRSVVQEAESLRKAAGFVGSVVALDPGAPDEAQAGWDAFAHLLALELQRRGADPHLLGSGGDRDPSSLAREANAMSAALCVSIRERGDGAGITCAYFGTATTHSPAGKRLAGMLLERLSEHSGIAGGEPHPMAIGILRETRMPAVMVAFPDPSQSSGGADITGIVNALAAGIQAFLSTPSEG
jgi:N-acetylmuramoyl-L-alanine amidase